MVGPYRLSGAGPGAGARTSPRLPILFHELVHLVQCQMLGTERYLDGYVRSWAENGREYRSIAFEDQGR